MNMRKPVPLDFDQAVAARLTAILDDVPWLGGWTLDTSGGQDLVLQVPVRGGGKATLFVACRKELRPAMFSAFDASFSSAFGAGTAGRANKAACVLAMPTISPRMADLCRERGWGWLDLAGNCRLDIPGVLRVERTGAVPVAGRPSPKATLASAAAARVVRLLLAPGALSRRWTQRSLQAASQPAVSLGLVNKLVRTLLDDAYLVAEADGGVRVQDPEKLLLAWCDAYRADRYARRSYFTLLSGERLRAALAELGRKLPGQASLGVFSAAELLAPHVRQPKTWLCLGARHEEALRECLEAKPVDSGENLMVFFVDDDGVFFQLDHASEAQGGLPCTSPVQTYVDCSHAGGRGAEAAEALLAQRIRPVWDVDGDTT